MNQQDIFVQMALKAWTTQINQANKFFDSVNDEVLLKEVAPGKNRIIYLLGHLIAVNDSMITLFGLGERSYVHLDDPFLRKPDKAVSDYPGAAQLRKDWNSANETLSSHFAKMSPEDWFRKHTAMTDDDFRREPTRNKLSVLINRTNHVAYHLGQLVLAKEK
jgi:hypothetical protein